MYKTKRNLFESCLKDLFSANGNCNVPFQSGFRVTGISTVLNGIVCLCFLVGMDT